MYNLLVTGHAAAWDGSSGDYHFESSRFLQYTPDHLRARFERLRPETIAELCSLPALFAYESDVGKLAKVGRIVHIAQSDTGVSFAFRIDPHAETIERDILVGMMGPLAINPYELRRTHWAVKDVDLEATLPPVPSYVRENNLLADANRIALKAVRAILDAAESFEVSIESTKIDIVPHRLRADPWPVGTWGLSEGKDGPWPQPVVFECRWPGGKTDIVALAARAGGRHRDLVSIAFLTRLTSQQLVWINVAAWLRWGAGAEIPFEAWFSLSTRIPDDPEEKRRRVQRMLAVKALVKHSGLPLASESNVDAFRITLPDERVSPSPSVALRRLVHLALLKLPFWAKEQADVIDGKPYLDPDAPRWSGSEQQRPSDRIIDVEPGADEDESSRDDGSDEPGVAAPVAPIVSGPARWLDERLDLKPADVQPFVAERRLEVADALVAQLCAALSSGKHVLVVGPPGTGKTELSRALADGARNAGFCSGAFVATASADWSTFDTIGGYAMEKDGRFAFRSGVFLRALEQQKWLILDEINRADIDRSFGELMTVLAGGRTDTPFTLADGAAISIGPGSGESHRASPTFRVLATMNTWDKTSLFRLSYAVQRRFAVVHVGPPADETYARILDREAVAGTDAVPALEPAALERMKRLFHAGGILAHRPIGPAVAADMVRYQRQRRAGGAGLAEAISLLLLPQLEGLDAIPATEVFQLLDEALDGWAGAEATGDLRARFRDLFPSARLRRS